MVPWLWFLSQTSDCRIFQNKTVPEIIIQIFQEFGFRDFRNAFQSTYEPREVVVQYRESDFNFISRLMEQAGIFYFFEHERESTLWSWLTIRLLIRSYLERLRCRTNRKMHQEQNAM